MTDGESATPSREERADTIEYEDWREALEDGVLLGQECPECGHTSATPRRACLECGATPETVELPTEGVVHSETSIEVTPEEFDDAGYRVGIVDLGAARILGRLGGDVAIGDDVALAGVVDEGGDPAPRFD